MSKNERLQAALTTAYELLQPSFDGSIPLKDARNDLGRVIADRAAKEFLESIEEDDYRAAVRTWNNGDSWVKHYTCSVLAEIGSNGGRGSDEAYRALSILNFDITD